jgi:demethylmenaquinone methyltransferase/2-methoxy-6-polyprenyl-1,4-benzoquinol methylase
MNTDLISYYKDRAKEYEKIYSKPERQLDLLTAGQILQDTFSGLDVLEIACGTGYWTEKISGTAKSILATDINDIVIEIAKSKKYLGTKVDFQIADMFNLTAVVKRESLFGGFIWSHIKLQDLKRFIDVANSLVKAGGTIVFMDNNYVEGSNLPLTEKDDSGNTYHTRTLEDGTTHKVLKNFPSEAAIREVLTGRASEIDFIQLQYYWILKYQNL